MTNAATETQTKFYDSVVTFALGIQEETANGWEIDLSEYRFPTKLGISSYEVNYYRETGVEPKKRGRPVQKKD